MDDNTVIMPRRKPNRSSLVRFIALLRTVISLLLDSVCVELSWLVFCRIRQSLGEGAAKSSPEYNTHFFLVPFERIFAMVGRWSRWSSFDCSSHSSFFPLVVVASFAADDRCCSFDSMLQSDDGFWWFMWWMVGRGFAFDLKKFSIFHNQPIWGIQTCITLTTCIQWGQRMLNHQIQNFSFFYPK